MAFWDNIRFPYFNMQELNLDWIMKELKRITGFMPQDGNVGDILTRKSDGAAWEPPEAVNINIDALPQDTQIMDNDQLIFYDISAQANRKIKPPDMLDSMCSNGTPLMNGTGAAGTSKKPARYDHVHPTDTSRAPANYFQNGDLKVSNGGTGANNAADALVNLGAIDISFKPIWLSATLTELPATITNTHIPADTATTETHAYAFEFGTPSAITSDLTYTITQGQVVLSGTMSGSTTVKFAVAKFLK